MTKAGAPNKPVVPDAPGLWWLEVTKDGDQSAVRVFEGGRGLTFEYDGEEYLVVHEAPSHWLGPVPSFAESKRHREALERIKSEAGLHNCAGRSYEVGALCNLIEAISEQALSAKRETTTSH